MIRHEFVWLNSHYKNGAPMFVGAYVETYVLSPAMGLWTLISRVTRAEYEQMMRGAAK